MQLQLLFTTWIVLVAANVCLARKLPMISSGIGEIPEMPSDILDEDLGNGDYDAIPEIPVRPEIIHDSDFQESAEVDYDRIPEEGVNSDEIINEEKEIHPLDVERTSVEIEPDLMDAEERAENENSDQEEESEEDNNIKADDNDDDYGTGDIPRGHIFDNAFFNMEQMTRYLKQLESALNHVFRQTVEEAILLNGTYANTTEEEVNVNGTKYIVQKSILKSDDDDTSILIETVETVADTNRTKRSNWYSESAQSNNNIDP